MSISYEGLVQFLEDELAVAPGEVAGDTPLFSSGLIDSFSLVALMAYLEKEGGIVIAPGDVELENFDSIDRILSYVSKVAA